MFWISSISKCHGELLLITLRASASLCEILQQGNKTVPNLSPPMPSIGIHCHELRIRDTDKNWRIIYRIDDDAILIVEVFNKTTRTTSKNVIEVCKKRLSKYDTDQQE
ncbi:type II toxin-antitoxin system RelE/ParE family toxin [Nostoc sp. 'Lobaria pulmonaria (5183) cyanobiont']|uniref:type II toxin-antitoxin system RelE/ParE family toxin n=2 Tax=unclassified Nostoc TaxID=2593658 RepID=UPI002D77C570|nr:type II toxin-antitoxin system RelE/ParE family toxin [Nostoc sp. 'Lobaria pulmonaria (5183) cyanobiont']